MAEVQLRQLRVSAELDSSKYVAGARDVADASRTAGAAVAGVGTAVSTTDSRISSSVTGFERLKRQFIDGYAAANDLDAKIKQVSSGMERGAISANEASRAIEGIVRRYGLMADASSFASRGQMELAAAVERANAKLREQSSIRAPAMDVNGLRAAQTGANFASDLNARLGIGAQSGSARASAAVFEEAAREAERFAQQAAALRAQLDPVAASQARMNDEIAQYVVLLGRAEISAAEFAKAEGMARARHEQFVASLNTGPIASNDNNSQFRRQNLGYQLFDVAQMQALGQNPMMTFMQQGPQIAQLYAGNGGVTAALKDLGVIAGGVVSTIGGLPLALGAAGVAAIAYFALSKEETKNLDELIKQQTASLQSLGNAYGDVAAKAAAAAASSAGSLNNFGITSSSSRNGLNLGITQATTDALSKILIDRGGGGSGNQFGPAKIVDGQFSEFSAAIDGLRNSALKGTPDILGFRKAVEDRWAIEPNNDELTKTAALLLEYTANAAQAARAVKELEIAQRALFNNVGPGGFLLSQGTTNREDNGNLAAFLEQQRVQAERARQAFDAQVQNTNARTPQEKASAAEASAAAQYNESETPAARAQRIELAGKQALIAAERELKLAQEDRQRSSEASLAAAQYELSLAGKSIEERNRLIAAYQAEAQIREAAARAGVAADEQEIATARAKAAALAEVNTQISARKMLQDQGYQIEQLRLEAQLVGASASERARATAALQAEQQLRQQGISLLSQEGQLYVANAQAMAQARLEIERQNAAYASLQTAGGSAIDSLTVGTGSLKDRLKSAADTMLQWIQQLTIANPLKNALFGSNLPTMSDLFSGRTAVPGATSTATMSVTAGTVMVNGGLTPGANPAALLNPANNNVANPGLMGVINPTNGVRPDLTGGGIVNSPVLNPASAVPGTSTQSQVWNYWAAKGLPPHQIAGIMGNMQAESAFNPAAVGDGGNAWGLAQWNDRRNAMVSYVGSDWRTDTKGQLDFMNHEFQTSEAASWARLRSSTDVRSATAAVAGFERPQGYSLANPENSHNWTGRLDAANSNLAKFSSTTASSTKSLDVLGESTSKVGTQITDSLGKITTPTAPMPVPTPTAPASGGNIFSSLFGGFFKLLGFADGTDFAPGGPVWVGERGRELVNLPRGSQVTPNHKLPRDGGQGGGGGGRMQVDVGVSVDRNGNLDAWVRDISRQESEGVTRAGISAYDSVLPDKIEEYRMNPQNRAG